MVKKYKCDNCGDVIVESNGIKRRFCTKKCRSEYSSLLVEKKTIGLTLVADSNIVNCKVLCRTSVNRTLSDMFNIDLKIDTLQKLKELNMWVVVGRGHNRKTYVHPNIITTCTEYYNNRCNLNMLRYESDFVKVLSDLLNGVCEVKTQYKVGNYRLDMYIESVNLAIEYDEQYHKKKFMSINDKSRQKDIESMIGCKFIRIPIGYETKGINLILKFILNHNALGSQEVKDYLNK